MNKSDKSPSVCICVPTYNAGKTLEKTLLSISRQTYNNITVIVVDNASSDDTARIAEKFTFNDSRFTICKNELNIGAEGNFNRCIKLACSDYTAIFHADDIYAPDIIEKQLTYLEKHQNAGAVFCCAKYIDEQDNCICDAPTPHEILAGSADREYSFRDVFPLILRDMNFLVCPSAMVRTAVYNEHVAVWDSKRFASSADLWVWLRILEKYTIGILPERLINYRISSFQGGSQLRHLNTNRADFFLVTDYYCSLPWVAQLLLPQMYSDLRFLEAIDSYARAVNAVILGDSALARDLTTRFLTFEFLQCAIRHKDLPLMCRNRFRYVVYFYMIWFLCRIPGARYVGKLLYRLRYGKPSA